MNNCIKTTFESSSSNNNLKKLGVIPVKVRHTTENNYFIVNVVSPGITVEVIGSGNIAKGTSLANARTALADSPQTSINVTSSFTYVVFDTDVSLLHIGNKYNLTTFTLKEDNAISMDDLCYVNILNFNTSNKGKLDISKTLSTGDIAYLKDSVLQGELTMDNSDVYGEIDKLDLGQVTKIEIRDTKLTLDLSKANFESMQEFYCGNLISSISTNKVNGNISAFAVATNLQKLILTDTNNVVGNISSLGENRSLINLYLTNTPNVEGSLEELATSQVGDTTNPARTSGSIRFRGNGTITYNGTAIANNVQKTIKFGSSMTNPTAEDTARGFQVV